MGGRLPDLRTLANGFLDLASAAAAPPPEPKKAEAPAAPPAAATPPSAPREPKIWTAEDPGVTPPVAIRQDVPRVPTTISAQARERGILDVIIDEHDGQPCIVMEYVQGTQLETLIVPGGLPSETFFRYSLQIADARIISPALLPLKPDRPPTLVLLLVAASAMGRCAGIRRVSGSITGGSEVWPSSITSPSPTRCAPRSQRIMWGSRFRRCLSQAAWNSSLAALSLRIGWWTFSEKPASMKASIQRSGLSRGKSEPNRNFLPSWLLA